MLLILLAVLTLGIIWVTEKSPPKDLTDDLLVSNSLAIPQPETLGASTTLTRRSSNWKPYSDKVMGFQIQYPDGITAKKENNGSLTISKDGLFITISSETLPGKDTVNTIAEQDINQKINIMGDNFKLLETISPVSIGSITGITYTTAEDSKEITYFYVPKTLSYLLITNSTDTSDDKLISTSDDIIYSLELLEK
ncbi:MAG: hypothetical protein UW88_C0002G0086 [Candidatus Collierbacteria bacterium GW2011_GWD2_45_10]|uniref:Uncharacterized protein n=1 Tax=Candidatus Collierbacteria bacterium GW2011_GWB2_44_22 TaxID=1618387 RepID=A0A0G1K5Q4_9BACT|nr:MAG: hypothetical protein UW31_C0005G0122 [Candidatus Collierbacteria bacterium GW2011_GWA2_44_13]KKT51612.1 MAG: hypothetical protein UW44_C0010G0050 [Candidatus Collierbacteria bacterium GW2011_GWB2_44_22]KKT63063.1 MAG: hypothetical protein UW56_C0002G0048 [Candidatus Collierbacteria bacterium GW2011_GWD1_44_27]KKT66422.1 MAG: hypothetical protein UW58_C0008G0015 [Candidatus Collierbacteria bacterium GW2011_GWC2_44_30]KKT89555.1 MAG: hypothetical protein UW88_C0002G0086 [Candidatus Collie